MTLFDLTEKQCPLCEAVKPILEFGVCRSRKDGRNLYCKPCIRGKVTASRRALKEYKAVRQNTAGTQQSLFSAGATVRTVRLTPRERVAQAIRRGARTQPEIATATKLKSAEIGEALAELLLWHGEIRTEVIDGVRHYLPASVIDHVPTETITTLSRQDDLPAFNAIRALMPGKHPAKDPKRNWKVA